VPDAWVSGVADRVLPSLPSFTWPEHTSLFYQEAGSMDMLSFPAFR